MAKLPWAKMSPRIENGVLFWYEGDTFHLLLRLELTDQDGTPVIPGAEDTLELCFHDARGSVVQTLSFTGDQAPEGILSIHMDEAMTALFPAGQYTYDLRLLGQRRITLIRGGEITVE